MLRASESARDLWAKAAELERDFAGYKRRLAERRACAAVAAAGDGYAGGGGSEQEEVERGAGEEGRGRRYEEYVRRRDERLRQEWRARMERKEAEMKELWARLDRAASSRGRRGGDGELAASSHDRDQQKPVTLEVKVKPTAPVTPRCSPATKLTRSRISVPPSPAVASPRLSTPDARRRPSHRHFPQADPPATPRRENKLPPPSNASAAPATPRPRTALSRSRSMVNKDRSCFSGRESPRPPRFLPPRTSCDGISNGKEAPLSPDHHNAIAMKQSRLCSSEHAVLAHLKKACAVAPEPFRLGRSGGNGAEPATSLLETPKDEPDSNRIAPDDCSADNKCNNNDGDDVDQSSAKSGSPDITGDSDTEPSYVYIKRDSSEEISQVSAGPGTRPQAELLSEDKDSCNFEGTMASSDATNTIAGESPVVDAEEESRRASSESLYSNVRSSFSQRSEHDTSAPGSPLCSTPPTDPSSPVEDAARPGKNRAEEDAEKNLRTPTSPGSSVTVSITVQSPMDAMAGLKRLLTFGKKNGKAGEVATTVLERTPRSLAPAPPAGDSSMTRGWPTADSVKATTGSSDSNAVASDALDNSYAISPHVRSLQSFTPSSPANHEMKEVLRAKSPRVHRSFFSLPSFKSRGS